MTNLLLLWPSISRDVVDIAASESFHDILSVTNLIGGERRNIAETLTLSSNLHTLEYQLQSGTSQTADYVGIARADLLQSSVSRFKVQHSTVSYFSPLAISSLTGWWDANRGITLNSGNVSVWTSVGGSSGASFLQPTAGGQPTYGNDWALNSNNYITNLTTRYLAATGIQASALFTAGAFCYWCVFTVGANLFTQSIFGEPTNSYIRLHQTSARVITASINDGSVKTAVSAAQTVGTVIVCEVRYDGATIYLNVNGVETTGASGNPTSLAWGPAISEGTNGHRGVIGELITCNAVPSAQERSDVRDYLTEKWKSSVDYTETSFSAATLLGSNETDFVDVPEFGLGTGRFWWISYLPSAPTKLRHSKLFLGDALDLGKDPDFVIDRGAEVTDVFIADSGAVKMGRAKDPLYTFTMTWKGITDAKLREFENAIALNAHKDGVILYTSAQHQILDGKGAMHCRVLSAESRQSGQIADYNELRVVFQEMEG